MGSQKQKIRLGFQSAFSIGIITYHMRKNICIGISTLLCAILIYIGLSQHLSV